MLAPRQIPPMLSLSARTHIALIDPPLQMQIIATPLQMHQGSVQTESASLVRLLSPEHSKSTHKPGKGQDCKYAHAEHEI